MIRFYTNRELSHRLGINLARWKRWSREFLPPDPLGGIQSGYARQYNPDEAFTVFFGGYLVGNLKFSIPEAKRILADLQVWLLEHGFYFGMSDSRSDKKSTVTPVSKYRISIRAVNGRESRHLGFIYSARGVVAEGEREFDGVPVKEQCYVESRFGLTDAEKENVICPSSRVIFISELRNTFLNRLQATEPNGGSMR
jgi:hypothetical protein